MMNRVQILTRITLWALLSTCTHAFLTSATTNGKIATVVSRIPSPPRASAFPLYMVNDEDPSPNNNEDEIDFLDRQFFDPSTVKEGSPLKWFANLVENDYETAEALFASFIIALLVVFTQELLRFQINGDAYIPFKKLGGSTLW